MDITTLPLPKPPSRDNPLPVQVKLTAPLPASAGNAPLALKVVSSQPNGQVQLSLPSGQTITATLSPPATVGSSVTITPPGANVLQAVGRLLPPPIPTSTPTPQPTPVMVPTSQVVLQPPASPLPPGPVLVVPPPTVVLPQGQVAMVIIGQPNVTGQQTAVVASPQAQQVPSADAMKVQVNAGLPLPVGSKMMVTVQPQARPQQGQAAPATAIPVAASLKEIVLPLVSPQGQVVQMSAPMTAPPSPAFLSALKVLVPPTMAGQLSAPLPEGTPVQARVLAPPAPTPNGAASQPIVLANGQPAVVQLPSGPPPRTPLAQGALPLPTNTQPQQPAGLPQGSVVMVEFSSVGSTGRVTQVEPAGGATPSGVNSGGAGGPQANTQTAAGVKPQTTQAVLAPGQVVTGSVTGQNPQAQQITITLPLPPGAPELAQPTSITLHSAQQLPVGAQVTVKIGVPNAQGMSQGTLINVALPGNFNQNQALAGFAKSWESLQAGLATLRTQNPNAAATLAARLPHLAALGATLLPYLEALQKNDPARAFGREEMAILKAMGHDLGADFVQMQSLHQPTPEGWRGILFPYMETPSADPQQGGFFWRRQKNEDDPEKPTSTRFVVQLGLSQLGEVQLDGLLAYPELWLKLRRKTANEPGFVENLQTVVETTLAALGLQGGIAVETTSRFVDPAGEILSHAGGKLSTEV